MRSALLPAFLAVAGLAPAQSALTLDAAAPPIHVTHWLANAPGDTSLRGQPLVLEFWTTWCGPCIDAVPHMNELQAAYASRGVRFVSLTDEPVAKVARTLARIPFASAVATDTTSRTQVAYGDGVDGLEQYPMTVLVDAAGLVKWIGTPTELTAEVMDAFVAGTLEAKSSFTAAASAKTRGGKQGSAASPAEERFSMEAFFALRRDPNLVEIFELRASATGPEEGSSMNAAGDFYCQGCTLATLFKNLLEEEVTPSEEFADRAYDLLYAHGKGTAVVDPAALRERILAATGLRAEARTVSREMLEVRIVDRSKLPVTANDMTSTASSSRTEVMLDGMTLADALVAYAEDADLKPFFAGEDDGRYDLILSTKSEAALVKDLRDYGLSVEKVTREVEIAHLLRR